MANDFLNQTNGNIFFDLANNISQMVWIADEKGKIIWYNQRWQDYTGSTSIDVEWWHLYHPEDIEAIKAKMKKGTTQKKAWEGTFRIKNQQEKYHWFLTRVVPNIDQKNNELRWFGTHTNVSRLVKLENDIINEKELLQAVIDKIPAMVTIYNPDTMRVKLNPAFENLIGWTNEDARNHNIMELVYPDPDYRQEVMEFMQKLGPFFKDIDMLTKNGKVLKTSWANERLSDGRQVGIGIDITERKQMEEDLQDANLQLLNLNRLMENLLYMAAHDLKSPIANLNLIMTLIEDEKDLDEKIAYFPKITAMIKRLEGVIEGLSEFIESQQQRNDLSIQVDLNALMKEVIKDFSDEIAQKSAEIDYDLQVKKMNYEHSVLRNILKNLLSNALKYAHPQRGAKINVRWEQVDGHILLSVADNGIGIDLNKYGRQLFRPFKRFSSQAWGSGIGLFIIKNFVERNGGFIEVESEPGQGTTFNCYLKESDF